MSQASRSHPPSVSQLAAWIVDGRPSVDLSNMDIARFGSEWDDDAMVRAAADERYATFYRATL